MAKKKFNPGDFLQKEKTTTPPIQAPTATFIPTDDVAADIQSLVEQVEASAIDITAGYEHWRNIGFALVEALGEDGRDFFHRLSRFNADYDHAEADRQYSACLRSRNEANNITPRSLFYIAQQYGITIHSVPVTASEARQSRTVFSPVSPKSSISSVEDLEETGETEDMTDTLEQIAMPTFSDKVSESLPLFLRQVVAKANSPQDADMLILGTLAVVSACMPNVYGLYDDREVFPNLFLFVTAQASAGKGRLSLCRHIVQPVHDRLAAIYEAEMADYQSRLSEYARNKDGSEPPQKPPRRVLFIPANTSSTKFYKTLKDNGETGIMFETEGDTLVNAFKSDYGNYSDGFRKAFHHESITYSRVKDDEYTEIKKPRLSALLSGTPRQIQSLIPDAENGLFSRFIFYCLNVDLEWHDVFAHQDQTPIDDYFRQLGKDYYNLYQILLGSPSLMFCVTASQRQQFHELFQEIQNGYVKILGYDFLASVRRLGLITYRIAMILSVLRIHEFGEVPNPLMCEDDDFNTAVAIIRVLIQHASRVFQEFPKDTPLNPMQQSTQLRQRFFDALPAQFDRSTYLSVAQLIGIRPKTAEKTIAKFREQGLILHEAQNKYLKR
jgi:hypothetical protein